MHVTRLADAAQYDAPGHTNVCALRLHGGEASPARGFWCGLSYYLPGAQAEERASEAERVYVCVAGRLAVRCGDTEEVLGPLDSCYVAPGEKRRIENKANEVATILVIAGSEQASGH